MSRPIVLIHGAWHGAWCWEKVLAGLREHNLSAIAIDLPFTSFADDIEAARRAIEAHPGSLVVGHSYGGAIITEAAKGLDVSHLVYLAALMQDKGESVGSLMASAPPTPLTEAMRLNDDGSTTVDPEAALEAFYSDCAPREAQLAVLRLRPIRFTPPEDKASEPAWHDIESTYVLCAEDRALDPTLQRRLADHATHVVEWETSHSPFLSRPELLVDLLSRLAS